MAFNTIDYDTANGFNTSTYSYTVKKTGYYSIATGLRISINGSTTTPFRLWYNLLINGGGISNYNINVANANNWETLPIADNVFLNINDVIKMNLYNGGNLSQSVENGTSWFSATLTST